YNIFIFHITAKKIRKFIPNGLIMENRANSLGFKHFLQTENIGIQTSNMI
ncbi:unnamed protein product, partial [marine sediment metagenome]